MIWYALQTEVRNKECTTKEEVAQAVHDFQMSLTPHKCRKYIDKLPEVIRIIIDRGGKWSNR